MISRVHLEEAIVTRDKVDETPLYLSMIRMSSVWPDNPSSLSDDKFRFPTPSVYAPASMYLTTSFLLRNVTL